MESFIKPINNVVSIIPDQTLKATQPNEDNSGTYYYSLSDLSTKEKEQTKSINIDKWHQENLKNEKINFIKIDVEGAELNIIRSCNNIINSYKPILYIEISEDHLSRFNSSMYEIEDYLKSLNYSFFRNTEPRNSNNDKFFIENINNFSQCECFFDLLSIHKSHSLHPNLFFTKLNSFFRKFNRYFKFTS